MSRTGVSALAEITGLVITSLAFMTGAHNVDPAMTCTATVNKRRR